MAGWREQLSRNLSLEPPQRRVIGVMLGLVLIYGVIRLTLNPIYIADPQPTYGDRSQELADRLNPNTASAADLAALPGLGDKRAAAIVVWRDKVREREPNRVPFRSLDDLYYVSGFGQSMVDNLRPYFHFPATRPTEDIGRTAP